MAEINESVWGEKELWIDIDQRFDQWDVPEEFRIKVANFTGETSTDANDGSVGVGLAEDVLELETPWDNSLSYAALGSEHPLSHIQYWGWKGDETDRAKLRIINQDNFNSINYALGENTTADGGFITISGFEYSNNKARYSRWTNGAQYSGDYSNYRGFKPYTQLPIMGTVLVPRVICYPDTNWNSGDRITTDLATYLSEKKTSHPYVAAIDVWGYFQRNDDYDAETGTGTPSRTGLYNQVCPAILENLSYGNGYEQDGYHLDNTFKPIFTTHIAGFLSDTGMPDNQGDNTWIVAVASGFGLDFTKFAPSSEGAMSNGARFYCDASQYTTAEFLEAVRKMVACFGLFFVDSEYAAEHLKLDEEGMFLGILRDGVGHGDYSEGSANREQMQWGMDDAHDIDYDPTNPPEPGDNPSPSGEPMLPVGLTWTLANTGTGIWALTPTEIDQVWKDIFGADIKATAFGNQPLNAILSLEWTPFTWTTNDDGPIILGDQIVNVLHAYPHIDSVSEAEKHASGQMRFKFNKNFYNARNMQARLFLPFYGYYELPAAQLLSSQLRVDFYYNVPDELAVYIISYDKVIYDFVECNCKIEIPITGSNAAAIRENKRSEALTIATQIAALAATAYFGASGIKAIGAGLSEIGAAAVETSAWTGGSFIGSALKNIGPLARDELLQGFGKGLAGAGAATIGAGVGGVNTIHKAEVQRAALKTNLPYHGSALQTTFLHMSMKPYVQIFKNAIMSGLTTSKGGTVEVELGGDDEKQYMLKVGHACDVFTTIDNMPENSLLQTTGCGDMSSMGMELSEYQELNAILQSGFYK